MYNFNNMTNYWDERFLGKMNENMKTIFEVGARYGDETLEMSRHFTGAKLYSFECNPNTVELCRSKLEGRENIYFNSIALGNENSQLPFYAYVQNNDGASSFYRRIDGNETQKINGYIKTKKLVDFMKDKEIDSIDLLCMDVQGYELNILKGAEDKIKNIKYIIMEEPNPTINEKYLPKNTYSKYIGSPNPQEISNFMTNNNFIEIERISENAIEDNVMYKNLKFIY